MARRHSDSLVFDTIRLEGGLLVPAVLEKVARGEHSDQSATDYQLPKGLSLADEQGRAFRIASALWKTFQPTRERSDIDAHRATTGFATEFLRDALGYSDIAPATNPIELANRSYPVTAFVRGRVAVIVAPHALELDVADERFAVVGSGRRRLSAYQLAQQFLNASEPCTWALLTNGHQLRLVRDADTLTRPAFLEFDLDLILRDQRYADFRALWLVLHASRAGTPNTPGNECVWEAWKKEGESQGERVRDGLRNGVTSALLTLGTGFLAHRQNEALRQRLQEGSLTTEIYFQQLLRLIYRFLLLFCAEERELLHPDLPEDQNEAAEALRARKAYASGYAIRRLRQRCLRRAACDQNGDQWTSLRVVFRALASGEPKLALPALGGLFANSQCPDLDAADLSNRDLLAAMRELRWFSDPRTGQRSAIDYRNMGPEELGSVYESLLELIPTVDLPARVFGFVGITDEGSAAGNTRKTTGSYYTPDSLVQELIKSALDPVIAQKVADHPDNPTAALLTISVIDPACGSGHFLISAARRLAERLAELRATDGADPLADYRRALREVISHCIYGVDRNPMALELARTALWLEGFEPRQPLSFLDHHLQCGDALLGLTDFDQLRHGIAKDAFTVLSGDHKDVCKSLAATNRDALKTLARRFNDGGAELFDARGRDDALQRLTAIEAMRDGSTAEVEEKKAAFTSFLAEARDSPLAHACDLLVAAYLTPKTPDNEPLCPSTATLLDVLFPQQGNPPPQAVIDHATECCREARVFHWPLRFAHIFGHGGFDCVLGNPPWERIKLQEQEFFAAREPTIAAAKNKAERSKRIQWLSEGSLHYHLSQFESAPPPDPNEIALFREFESEKRLAEATSAFAHVNGEDGGRFPLTGVGDVNTYALFSETISQITSMSGRAGFIVPTGIATDDSTKAFFTHLIGSRRLASLFDFQSSPGLFVEIGHATFKFCLITFGPPMEPNRGPIFSFFLRDTAWLHRPETTFPLSAEEIDLINPNTHTCPIFRSRADAELTKKIYRRVPVFIKEARNDEPEKNPWSIRFLRMFDMAGDSHLFQDRPTPDSLPLYEAKMIHQFDHRWATFTRNISGELDTADVSDGQKQDPSFRITPRYWVPERQVLARIANAPKRVRDAFRDQDVDTLLSALAIWMESRRESDLLDGMMTSTARLRVIDLGGSRFESLPTEEKDWLNDKALDEARDSPPLTDAEIAVIRNTSNLTAATRQLLDERTPRWLMGWRDISKSQNERTVIATVTPRASINDKLLLMRSEKESPSHMACLLAEQNSLVHDFIARQKIGGTSLKYFTKKQLPIIPPTAYTDFDLTFIVPRVLELTYTADDLSGWARDLGYDGPPFRFDPDRRALLRAELDAYYARLYGLTREELQYILDPASTHGPDYPTVTFPGLKKNEIAKYGEYRTQRLVLEAWDELAARDTVPIDVPTPRPLRVPFSSEDITHYFNFLVYAWAQNGGDHADLRSVVRAFTLLQFPQRISARLHHEEPGAKDWLKSFREPIKGHTLRPVLEALIDRKAIRLVPHSSGEFMLKLGDAALAFKIPGAIQQDADLSLRAARLELTKESPLSPTETAEFDQLRSLVSFS